MKWFSSRFLSLLLVLLSIGALLDLEQLLNRQDYGVHKVGNSKVWPQAFAAPIPTASTQELQPRARKPRVGIVLKTATSNTSSDSTDVVSGSDSNSKSNSSSSSPSAFASEEGARVGMKVQLKRFEPRSLADGTLNPLMMYQSHLNRANAKLAGILGTQIPSAQKLDEALQRRRLSILAKRSNVDTQDTMPSAHLEANQAETPRKRYTNPRQGYTRPQETDPQGPLQRRFLSSFFHSIFGGGDVGTEGGSKYRSAVASVASEGYPQADLNASLTDQLISASAPTAVQSLGLDIESNDIGYVATIQIGSSNTSFRMLIDSGSADTWVPSTSCQGCGSTHQKLGKSVSTTFKASNTPFSIQYGTGSVEGNLATDDLKIAGLDLKSYTFAVTTQESSDFSDDTVPFDGLMGLARSELSNAGQPTPIDALFGEGDVQAPVMGYHLGRVADGYNDGEVTFGGVEPAKFTGNLTEIPNVSQSGFWEAKIDTINVGSKDLDLKSRTAILDTGTTLIVAPQQDADAVHAQIPGSTSDGQGGYTIPCTTTQQLSFTFGGTTFPIDTRDLLFLPTDPNNLLGDCVSAISAGNVGQANQWLMGATFLKNVYFATNTQANVIGLGRLNTTNTSNS